MKPRIALCPAASNISVCCRGGDSGKGNGGRAADLLTDGGGGGGGAVKCHVCGGTDAMLSVVMWVYISVMVLLDVKFVVGIMLPAVLYACINVVSVVVVWEKTMEMYNHNK